MEDPKKIKTPQEKAEAEYQMRKEAIKAISGTLGYKELVTYWQREIDRCDAILDTAKTQEEIFLATLEKRPIKKFLMYMNNLSK